MSDRTAAFLYRLFQQVPSPEVARLVRAADPAELDAPGASVWLARYAEQLATELRGEAQAFPSPTASEPGKE